MGEPRAEGRCEMAAQPMGRQRNAAVVILTTLAVVAGVLELVDVLRYLGSLPMGEGLSLQFYGVNWLGAILSAIVAAIWLSRARQLWKLDRRGWQFVGVIAIPTIVLVP